MCFFISITFIVLFISSITFIVLFYYYHFYCAFLLVSLLLCFFISITFIVLFLLLVSLLLCFFIISITFVDWWKAQYFSSQAYKLRTMAKLWIILCYPQITFLRATLVWMTLVAMHDVTRGDDKLLKGWKLYVMKALNGVWSSSYRILTNSMGESERVVSAIETVSR